MATSDIRPFNCSYGYSYVPVVLGHTFFSKGLFAPDTVYIKHMYRYCLLEELSVLGTLS